MFSAVQSLVVLVYTYICFVIYSFKCSFVEFGKFQPVERFYLMRTGAFL